MMKDEDSTREPRPTFFFQKSLNFKGHSFTILPSTRISKYEFGASPSEATETETAPLKPWHFFLFLVLSFSSSLT